MDASEKQISFISDLTRRMRATADEQARLLNEKGRQFVGMYLPEIAFGQAIDANTDGLDSRNASEIIDWLNGAHGTMRRPLSPTVRAFVGTRAAALSDIWAWRWQGAFLGDGEWQQITAVIGDDYTGFAAIVTADPTLKPAQALSQYAGHAVEWVR